VDGSGQNGSRDAAPGSAPAGRRWLVRNQTPMRLRIERTSHPIELAPLQTVRIVSDPNRWGPAAEEARAARALTWELEPVRTARERYAAAAVVAGTTALLATAVAVWLLTWPWAAGFALVVAVCSWCAYALRDSGRAGGWDFARGVVVRVLQALVLVVIVLVGLGLPFGAAFYGTEVAEVLDLVEWDLDGVHEAQQLLVARSVQFALIGVLTLLPALLYFQFDRERVETLLDRWLRHIFRFDPTLRTLDDVDARYGRRLEENYGTSVRTAAGGARHRGRSRSPVVLATLLLALGWVLVLVNTDAAGQFSSAGELPTATQLFDVARTPISFAFLGAYLYALQVVLRGYVRGDLRPKTYAAISVRVVISLVLAWAVQGTLTGVVTDSRAVLGLAFLAGVVPDTVLRYLRDAVAAMWRAGRGRMRASADRDELADRWPLTDLVGIDLYERTRLAEEGITNVQALAHHDVVDLTLSTRIPFERVVHWVDQAVLYEHVPAAHRTALRGHGVITATDLLRAAATERARLADVVGEGRLAVVLAAVERSDWVPQLLAWRAARTEDRAPVLTFPRTAATAAESGVAQPAGPGQGEQSPSTVVLPDTVPEQRRKAVGARRAVRA
jgi:hypothetical protein